MVQEQSKILCRIAVVGEDCTSGEGGPRMDGGRGWVDDGLTLLEWESFVGLVASVVEGVGIAIDARVEALHQQHDTDV